ncbi:hypothetical protein ACFL2V_08440 [Pseudomonadota bacterium]
MKQRTHTWLAIRAIALLEDSGDTPDLVKLLKPYSKSAAIGSWIPDLVDSRLGFGDIDNHIFKLKPYNGPGGERFVKNKTKTFKSLGPHRKIVKFIKEWGSDLDEAWWAAPYKADPAPGQHLANKAMSLASTLTDQLILGDTKLAALVPGQVRFASNLSPEARTRREEVATYFFMLSHFVADACQPCHCDARRAFGYSKGLHKEMEQHWDRYMGIYFDKKKLLVCTESANKVLEQARAVDEKIKVTFDNKVPKLKEKDTWLEVLGLCRASFAVASILVPKSNIAYSSSALTTFKKVFKGPDVDEAFLPAVDAAVLHDAVLNIAIVWKAIWARFDR